MDMEQLKMILEFASEAGVGAFWLALLMILKGYFIGAVFASVALFIVHSISKCTTECSIAESESTAQKSAAKNEAYLEQIMSAAGETRTTWYYHQTVPKVVDLLRSAKANSSETK